MSIKRNEEHYKESMEFDDYLHWWYSFYPSPDAITESRKRDAEYEEYFEMMRYDFDDSCESEESGDDDYYYSDEEDMLIMFEGESYWVPVPPFPDHKDIRTSLNKKHHRSSKMAYIKSKKNKKINSNSRPKNKSKKKDKGSRKFGNPVREYFYWW